ncbi:MAG: AraC family transcriptional regulator [Pseudomonadota bacterium]
MHSAKFHIDTYLGDKESYHFARKTLDTTPPVVVHRHDYFELFVVEKGTLRHWVNGQSETLERGAMVFMRPQDTHSVHALEEGTRIINVMFRPETAAHLLARYEPEVEGRYFWSESAIPECHLLNGPRIERAINAAAELETSQRSLARIEEFLLNVMLRVVDYSAVSTRAMPSWLVAACQAVRQPEVFRQGAAGFVNAAGRGHAHVCRVAKQHLGLSPSDYVNRLRMEHAAMQLRAGRLSVAEIAEDCGFESLAHFYKLFRQHYGVPPGQYLKQNFRLPS